MAWTSRVMTISLEMVIPALIGHWVDRWLGTGPVLLVSGAILGQVAGMWHLIQLTRPPGGRQGPPGGGQKDQDGPADKNEQS